MRKRNPLIVLDKFYQPDPFDRSTRTLEVSRAVLHCTGGGIVQEALDQHFGRGLSPQRLHEIVSDPVSSETVTMHCAEFYRKKNGVSTGFITGWCGERIQTQDEDVRAWSAGIKAEIVALYKRGFTIWSKYRLDGGKLVPAPSGYYEFWIRLYNQIHGFPEGASIPASASPLEFNGGNHGPDHVAISIDFVSPPYQRVDGRGVRYLGPSAPAYENGSLYTVAQLDSTNVLLRNLDSNYPAFAMDRQHILPHSFTSPIERNFNVKANGIQTGYGFDPGENLNWGRLLK